MKQLEVSYRTNGNINGTTLLYCLLVWLFNHFWYYEGNVNVYPHKDLHKNIHVSFIPHYAKWNNK
jgi:hypothetical protein